MFVYVVDKNSRLTSEIGSLKLRIRKMCGIILPKYPPFHLICLLHLCKRASIDLTSVTFQRRMDKLSISISISNTRVFGSVLYFYVSSLIQNSHRFRRHKNKNDFDVDVDVVVFPNSFYLQSTFW